MKEDKNKIYISTVIVFWILVLFFFLVAITEFSIGSFDEKYLNFINIPIQSVYTILGIPLIVLATKGKFTKISKAFFILTGASLIGGFLSYILSNFVFTKLLEFEPAPVIFIATFLVGMIGSIVLIAKKKVNIKN